MKPFKFEKGNWVEVIDGQHKGKYTTIQSRHTENYKTNIYIGYYLGQPLFLNENDLRSYE